jgi:phosphoribosylamine--glycine ligase
MNILVIGSGGREHALVWKLAQSRHRPHIYAAPGNPGMNLPPPAPLPLREGGGQRPGTAAIPLCPSVPSASSVVQSSSEGDMPCVCVPIRADDINGLLVFAQAQRIDLTIVGPEAPLMLGGADRFRAAGLRVCGPDRAAAQLEGSKAFAKELMGRAGIPTARHATFDDVAAARAYVERHGAPIVIKADGLAAGKGVTAARTLTEALQALEDTMERRVFGAAGDAVVIEEYLDGDELSVMALVAGDTYRLLLPSQDHKQVFDGDRGPNTGGMGAFAPVPWVDASLLEAIRTRIFAPLLAELGRAGLDYRGVIYAGLMITAEGPKVIEFNARFGDPEAQVVLPLLETDLVDLCLAVADGTLDRVSLANRAGAAVCVVLASEGYPGSYKTGRPITGLADIPAETLVFHAGTRAEHSQLVTAGGRVLNIVGLGADLERARAHAYTAAERITFAGKHYRRDIGRRPRRVG